MKLRTTALAPGLVLSLFVACGGPPPLSTTPTLPPMPSATLPPAPAAELGPVSEPETLVALVHVARPSRLAAQVSTWTGFPIPIEEALDEVLSNGLAAAVDTEQPIDLALCTEARGKHTYGVASVGVRSIDDARTTLGARYRFDPADGGAFKLVPVRQKGADDDEGGAGAGYACVLAPAYGGSGARIVCAKREKGLAVMVPYMTRGATRIASTADVHAEVRAEPLAGAVAQARALLDVLVGASTGSGDLAHAFSEELQDLASDLGRIVVDGTLDDQSGKLVATVSFKDAKAMVTRAAIAHADQAGPPPPAFLRLPADADVAFYESGIDPKELAHPRDLATEAVRREAEQRKLAEADRKALTDAVHQTLGLLSSPLVYARGIDVAGASSALAVAKDDHAAGPTRAAKERTAVERLGGWSLLGVEEPIAKVGALVKDWVKLAARPAFATVLKPAAKELATPSMKLVPLPKSAALPADSLHLEIAQEQFGTAASLAPGAKPGVTPKPAVVRTKLHLVLVPEGRRTWISVSMEEQVAIARAQGILGSRKQPTLDGRAGLEALRGWRTNAGGFVTMRGLALSGPVLVFAESPGRLLGGHDPLKGIGSQGQAVTPILMGVAAQGSQVGVGAMQLTFEVPRSAIRDVIQLGPRIFR